MKAKILLGACILTVGFLGSLRAESGIALVAGTSPESEVKGTVTFEDTDAGLKISAKLTGVSEGSHGFHIHQFGSCEDSGNAAGGHYNPKQTQHGELMKDGHDHAHMGDLGNIVADKEGNANLDLVVSGLTLSSGDHNVGGRAVILH